MMPMCCAGRVQFAEYENTTVVVWDINTEALQTVESEIRAKGARAFTYRVDISKREQVYDTAEKVGSLRCSSPR